MMQSGLLGSHLLTRALLQHWATLPGMDLATLEISRNPLRASAQHTVQKQTLRPEGLEN
jgi:hypothetical protein